MNTGICQIFRKKILFNITRNILFITEPLPAKAGRFIPANLKSGYTLWWFHLSHFRCLPQNIPSPTNAVPKIACLILYTPFAAFLMCFPWYIAPVCLLTNAAKRTPTYGYDRNLHMSCQDSHFIALANETDQFPCPHRYFSCNYRLPVPCNPY